MLTDPGSSSLQRAQEFSLCDIRRFVCAAVPQPCYYFLRFRPVTSSAAALAVPTFSFNSLAVISAAA